MAYSLSRLGPYKLLGKLGAGGMGEVHLAQDTRLNRKVAIKILPDAHADDQERRSRLMREALAAAALNHPNIATIYDVGEAEGRDYIAFERIDGQSLAEVLSSRGLEVDEILKLALGLADALAYAHEHGVIHRDVKTANVMLTERGEPKLLDFGLAKLERDADREQPTELTMTGAILGTPGAMSPEQAQGRKVDSRSDVFSFGSLLYELAARRPAFGGESVLEVVSAVLRDQPSPLAEARADLPDELVRIVEKALRKDPAERYQSMRDLIADLKHLDASRGTAAGVREKRPVVLLATVAIALGTLSWIGLRTFLGGESAPPGDGTYAGLRIGVIGFENVTDPQDEDHLVRMLVPLITTDLAESGGLEVLSTARVRESLRQVLGPDGLFDASFAREVARVAGAELMLVGHVMQDHGGLRVVGEIVEVASGTSLGSARAQANSLDDIFAVAAALCVEVRTQLGLLAGSSDGAPFDPAASLTRSTAAWNRFVAGRLALHDSDYAEAVQHFEAALREDETFALASFYLAMSHDWSAADDDREIAVLERGLAHIARLPRRWQSAYEVSLDWARNDWDSAYAKLTHLIEEPDVLPDVLNLMGEVVEHDAGHWNPGLARRVFERALEIDPTFEVVLFHLVDTLLLQGDDNALQALIGKLRARDSSSVRALHSEAMARIWHRDWEQAQPLVDELGRRHLFMDWWFRATVAIGSGRIEDAWPLLDEGVATAQGFLHSWALHARGLARMQAGRFEEALADFDAAMAPMAETGHADIVRGSITFFLHRALLSELIGDTDDAIATVRAAVELVPHEARAHYWLLQLLWRHGTSEEAAEALDVFAARKSESQNVSFPFWADMLEAERALQDGAPERAHAALSRAAAHPRETRDLSVQKWLEARVADAEGDMQGAIEAYADVVPTYSWYVEAHTQLSIEARLRRACLQQDTGDPSFDRADLEELVEAWGETGLSLVDDARRRLER